MRKISCEEIVCIESITDFQATYYITNLNLSDLIEDITEGCKRGFLDILDIEVFLYSLKFVPFTNEKRAENIHSELTECIRNQLYCKSSKWSIPKILKKIKQLQRIILWYYVIDGSLVKYNNNEINWDLDVLFILNKEGAELYSFT